jgi:hypothetical protein
MAGTDYRERREREREREAHNIIVYYISGRPATQKSREGNTQIIKESLGSAPHSLSKGANNNRAFLVCVCVIYLLRLPLYII